MKKIFVQCADLWAPSYYRGYLPARHCCEALQTEGIEVWYDSQLDTNKHFDAYIFQRIPTPPFLDCLKRFKDRGATLVWSLDDLLTHLPRHHPHFTGHGPKEMARLNEALDMADVILTTTETLAYNLARPSKTVVRPNLVDLDNYHPVKHAVRQPLTIFWQGADTHNGDLCVLNEIVPCVDEIYSSQVRWTFFGLVPNCEVVDLKSVHFEPPVVFHEYYHKLNALHGDIGLCPLESNRFNACKSNLKWLEYSALGMATIASDLPTYEAITHGYDGFRVYPDEWLEKIRVLIENEDLRVSMAEAAHEDVKKWSWQNPEAKDDWMRFFRHIVKSFDSSPV